MCVFGTRPEAIKMAPLVEAIRGDDAFECIVCVTAQHREMLDQAMDIFGLKADYDLDLMRPGQTLTSITAGVLEGMETVLKQTEPDLVLVHGDTTTSFAAGLAAFYQRIPVGHVEAGLRSYDLLSPYPEEMNRCVTDRLALLHFAPTAQNVANLAAEGITAGVYKTGNTVIDALHRMVRPGYVFHSAQLRDIPLEKQTVLLTAHRRENLGKGMRQIFAAVQQLCAAYPELQFIYPVHPNPQVRQLAQQMLGGLPQVRLIDPLDVQDMHNLISRVYFVMTDSGGLQEEAPALGKPVLVLRTETERPEAVEMGTVRMAGIETAQIVRLARQLLEDPAEYDKMANAVNPYGDGTASAQICAALKEHFGLI